MKNLYSEIYYSNLLVIIIRNLSPFNEWIVWKIDITEFTKEITSTCYSLYIIYIGINLFITNQYDYSCNRFELNII